MIDLGDEIVFGSRQVFTTAQHAVILDLVDDALGVFKSHTHGNALGLEGDAAVMQHLVNVACRMARGQDNRTAECLASRCFNARHLATVDNEVGDAGLEMDLATAAQDGLAHGLDDARQFVAADVGMGIDEDILSRPMLDKNSQNAVHRAALLAAGVEFTVTIGPCPTLTIAIVALGIDDALSLDA